MKPTLTIRRLFAMYMADRILGDDNSFVDGMLFSFRKELDQTAIDTIKGVEKEADNICRARRRKGLATARKQRLANRKEKRDG